MEYTDELHAALRSAAAEYAALAMDIERTAKSDMSSDTLLELARTEAALYGRDLAMEEQKRACSMADAGSSDSATSFPPLEPGSPAQPQRNSNQLAGADGGPGPGGRVDGLPVIPADADGRLVANDRHGASSTVMADRIVGTDSFASAMHEDAVVPIDQASVATGQRPPASTGGGTSVATVATGASIAAPASASAVTPMVMQPIATNSSRDSLGPEPPVLPASDMAAPGFGVAAMTASASDSSMTARALPGMAEEPSPPALSQVVRRQQQQLRQHSTGKPADALPPVERATTDTSTAAVRGEPSDRKAQRAESLAGHSELRRAIGTGLHELSAKLASSPLTDDAKDADLASSRVWDGEMTECIGNAPCEQSLNEKSRGAHVQRKKWTIERDEGAAAHGKSAPYKVVEHAQVGKEEKIDGSTQPLSSPPTTATSSSAAVAATATAATQRPPQQPQSWRKAVLIVWNNIRNHKNGSIFYRPVADEVAGYEDIVKWPMDLQTIKRRLDDGVRLCALQPVFPGERCEPLTLAGVLSRTLPTARPSCMP